MEERSTLSVSIQKVRSAMIGYVNGDSDSAITAKGKKKGTRKYKTLHTPNTSGAARAGEPGRTRKFCTECWKWNNWQLNPLKSHPKTPELPGNAMMDSLQISLPWPRKLLKDSAEEY